MLAEIAAQEGDWDAAAYYRKALALYQAIGTARYAAEVRWSLSAIGE